MTKTFDTQGRPIVSLSGWERIILGAGVSAILAVLGWLGVQMVDVRDGVKSLGQYRVDDKREIDDHEARLRAGHL